jgi:hypothetical protein
LIEKLVSQLSAQEPPCVAVDDWTNRGSPFGPWLIRNPVGSKLPEAFCLIEPSSLRIVDNDAIGAD